MTIIQPRRPRRQRWFTPVRSSHAEGGFATPLVLLLTPLLATLAIALIHMSRNSAAEAALRRDLTIALTRAEAGVERCISALSSTTDPLRGRLVADGRAISWDFDGSAIAMALEAETGKVDIHSANSELITRILSRLSPDQVRLTRMKEIVDHIRSQRIPTLRPLLDDMALAGHLPASTDRVITVHSGRSGIDPWTAQQMVLEALPGVDPEAAANFIERRDALRSSPDGAAAAVLLGAGATSLFTREAPTFTCRVSANAGRPNTARVSLARVVLVEGGEDGRPPRVLFLEQRASSPVTAAN